MIKTIKYILRFVTGGGFLFLILWFLFEVLKALVSLGLKNVLIIILFLIGFMVALLLFLAAFCCAMDWIWFD